MWYVNYNGTFCQSSRVKFINLALIWPAFVWTFGLDYFLSEIIQNHDSVPIQRHYNT